MPSRADLRRTGEWVLRVALVAMLAQSLWRALHEEAPRSESRRVRVATLARALDEATRSDRIGAIDVSVDSLPTPTQRAWLAGLRRAGVTVRWHGTPPAVGLAAERVREPDAPVRLLLAADRGTTVTVSDSAGALDTLRAADGGATLEAAGVVGPMHARWGAWSATVATPGVTERRDVLVLGRASWESKFVLAALAEAGWRVRARLPMAPGVAVADAGVLPIDTARYDVVVALDSSAVDLAPAVARFVANGGGLVAAGTATRLPGLRAIAPASAGARRPGRIVLDADSVTRAELPLQPLEALRSDAVPLERQVAGVAVAVRRAGSGRVLASGYDESWRWRMLGGASGPAAHRRWWSRTVGLVAPERETGSRATSGDAAPVAALVSALGPASASPPGAPVTSRDALPLVMLIVLAAALLAETASRRFRGAR